MNFQDLLGKFAPEAKVVLRKLALLYGPVLKLAIDQKLGETEKRLLAKFVYKATIWALHEANISTPLNRKTDIRVFLCKFLAIPAF